MDSWDRAHALVVALLPDAHIEEDLSRRTDEAEDLLRAELPPRLRALPQATLGPAVLIELIAMALDAVRRTANPQKRETVLHALLNGVAPDWDESRHREVLAVVCALDAEALRVLRHVGNGAPVAPSVWLEQLALLNLVHGGRRLVPTELGQRVVYATIDQNPGFHLGSTLDTTAPGDPRESVAAPVAENRSATGDPQATVDGPRSTDNTQVAVEGAPLLGLEALLPTNHADAATEVASIATEPRPEESATG